MIENMNVRSLKNRPLVIFFMIFVFCSCSSKKEANKPKPKVQKKAYVNEKRFNPPVKIKTHAGSPLENATFGLCAIDISNGSVVRSFNKDISMTPASIMKIITTFSAMDMIGNNYRFKTLIGYSGNIDGSTLNGDIVIIGRGDPTLASENFKNYYDLNRFTKFLKVRNINNVTGKVIIDNSLFGKNTIPDDWIWGDIGNYYGAAPFAINLYDNTYTVIFKSSKKIGEKVEFVKTIPEIPCMQVFNEVVSSPKQGDFCYIYGSPFENVRFLEGTIPRGKNKFSHTKGSIPDPALLLGNMVYDQLKNAGINIEDKSSRIMNYPNPEFIDTVKIVDSLLSPTLFDIARLTNFESINLYAEDLLLQIGGLIGNDYKRDAGINQVRENFQKQEISLRGFFMEDGSGLSRSNAIPPYIFAQFLSKYHPTKSKKRTYWNTLALAGKDGTLKGFGGNTKLAGNFKGKSGTMGRVKSYAGYLKTKKGKNLAVACMINNYASSASKAKKYIEQEFLKLYEEY